jgi:hypothetical protein
MNRAVRASSGLSYCWLAPVPHSWVYRLAIEPIVAADPEVRNFARLDQTEERGPMDPEVCKLPAVSSRTRRFVNLQADSLGLLSLSACLSFLALSILRQARQRYRLCRFS